MTDGGLGTPPNVVFILADQLRPDFLSCYGMQAISTPHIDAIAARGIRFDRAYSEHPVCVPARVSLLTGMHAVKTGVLDNGLFLRPDYRECGISTWPERLAESGYYTAAIGKMHFYPWDESMGFQYRRIAEDKRWQYIRDDYFDFLRDHGERKYHGNEHEGYFEQKGAIINRLPWELQPDHYVGQEACRFVREYGADGPFAMMVGFPGPHCPYDPAPEFLEQVDWDLLPEPAHDAGDTTKVRAQNVAGNKAPWNGVDYSDFSIEDKRRIRAHYAALVKQIDHEVGDLVETLQERGLLDNTVFILSADHGDYLGDHNLIGKGHFFESSFHVPMIVAGPGIAPGVSDDLVALTDVTATVLTLAGVPVPAYADSTPLPGVTTGAPGAGGESARKRERLIGALGGGWMIQEGPWRLSKYGTGETLLFNLDDDPNEQRNLALDQALGDVYRRLDATLTAWMMNAIVASHRTQRVYARDLSQRPDFGREGWRREYPHRLDRE